MNVSKQHFVIKYEFSRAFSDWILKLSCKYNNAL